MIHRYALTAMISAVLLTGCVSTRPLGNASQVATEQRVTLVEKAKRMGIYKVDDNHRGYGFVKRFQIAPGTHTITFTGMTTGYAIGTTIAEFSHSYNFLPGHTYIIQDASAGGAFGVQIVDAATDDELRPLGGA